MGGQRDWGHKSLCATVGTMDTPSSGSLWTQRIFSHHQTHLLHPTQSKPPALPPHPFGGKGLGTLINIMLLTSQEHFQVYVRVFTHLQQKLQAVGYF